MTTSQDMNTTWKWIILIHQLVKGQNFELCMVHLLVWELTQDSNNGNKDDRTLVYTMMLQSYSKQTLCNVLSNNIMTSLNTIIVIYIDYS